MRGPGAFLLAAAVGVGIAAAGPTRAAIDPTALLLTYEPVLLFHAKEDWAPVRADGFVRRARVETQTSRGKWSVVPGPLPTSTSGCTLSPCYRLNLQPCALRSGDACYEKSRTTVAAWGKPVVYGRVLTVPPGTPAPPGFAAPPSYLVRYWLFYDFDDWRSARERLWQAHEADWESITIGLSSTLKPIFAAYSQHCTGSIRSWPAVEKRAATHPVAYVALGSHANYFTNSSSSTRFTECLRKYLDRPGLARAEAIVKLAADRIIDRTGTAHLSGPPGVAGAAPLELVELRAPLPSWAAFPGRWSEGQLLWLGRTPRSYTSLTESGGPATPNWNGTSIPSYWHASSS